MLNAITNLWTARVLVIIGFLAGYGSVGSTFEHIGDDRFLPTHVWYHFFREGMGDVATMIAILVILFAAPRFRTPVTWSLMLILMLGFYGPFWMGMPFMAELAAPSMNAEIIHLSMAVPAFLGCFLSYRHFSESAHLATEFG